MERILCCGDREWSNTDVIDYVLTQLLDLPKVKVLIEGECRGADRLCRDRALVLGLGEEKILPFPANWARYRRAAGPIRNAEMLNEGRPTLTIAFHNCINESRGTLNMIEQSLKAGVPVWLVNEQAQCEKFSTVGEFQTWRLLT